MDPDAGLAGAVQETLQAHPPVEGALLIGWVVVAEYRTPEDELWLSKRSGDPMGSSLVSWREAGYLHSALNTSWEDED